MASPKNKYTDASMVWNMMHKNGAKSEAEAKANAAKGAAASPYLGGINAATSDVASKWNDNTVKSTNNKNAPEAYTNEKLVQAVQYLDSLTGQNHMDNPMRYIANGQAWETAVKLRKSSTYAPAVNTELDRIIAITNPNGNGWSYSASAGGRIHSGAYDAETAYTGSSARMGSYGNPMSKEASAVEYAANGDEDSLLNMANDAKSLQKAVQSAYLLYNNSGDERYEQAGETARRLLMHAMGADGNIPDPTKDENGFVDAWQKKKDYVTLILQLSQGADAAATTDAYVDVARYKELRDFISEANKNIKEHAGGNKPGATNSQPGTVDEALGRD